jgi:hypothetical protein
VKLNAHISIPDMSFVRLGRHSDRSSPTSGYANEQTFSVCVGMSQRCQLARNFSSTMAALSASNFPTEILMTGAFMSDSQCSILIDRSNARTKERVYVVASNFGKWQILLCQ